VVRAHDHEPVEDILPRVDVLDLVAARIDQRHALVELPDRAVQDRDVVEPTRVVDPVDGGGRDAVSVDEMAAEIEPDAAAPITRPSPGQSIRSLVTCVSAVTGAAV